ncbi:MAG: ribosome biogenesis GTPase Der [Gammaproteobacteria bacterium]|nr:ribosome biogenesis GTPase Der [Gammaproteobacteria bacterium]
MKPVIALIGRPNVGKSTLFNFLTRSRNALVADLPGLTRDRIYGVGRVGDRPYIVIDTGGLTEEHGGIERQMDLQVAQAIEEASVLLFLVDGRAGLTPADQSILRLLRSSGKRIVLVVNKSEGRDPAMTSADFVELGIHELHVISAAHGDNVSQMIHDVLASLPGATDGELDAEEQYPGIRIAIVGRPNVGKSTLVNRLLGEDRVIAFNEPGTTRDSIAIPFERDGTQYTLIDTAGIRRRSRVDDMIEKFSIVKTLQAISIAHVVVMVLDARQGISDQDAHLLGLVLENGKALVLGINKWDGLTQDARDAIRSELERRLDFISFAPLHFISALHGSGVGELMRSVDRSYAAAGLSMATPELTRLLEQAIAQHQPPLVHGRRIKLRYAHQGGAFPPVIVIHGNQTAEVPGAYRRYLENFFRERLDIIGTPIRIEFKSGDNPFKGRRNVLTTRQLQRRKRFKKMLKKRT